MIVSAFWRNGALASVWASTAPAIIWFFRAESPYRRARNVGGNPRPSFKVLFLDELADFGPSIENPGRYKYVDWSITAQNIDRNTPYLLAAAVNVPTKHPTYDFYPTTCPKPLHRPHHHPHPRLNPIGTLYKFPKMPTPSRKNTSDQCSSHGSTIQAKPHKRSPETLNFKNNKARSFPNRAKSLKNMVGTERFEHSIPSTPCPQQTCKSSNQAVYIGRSLRLGAHECPLLRERVTQKPPNSFAPSSPILGNSPSAFIAPRAPSYL